MSCKRLFELGIIILLVCTCFGCSGGGEDPISPATSGKPTLEGAQSQKSSHQLWGLWQFTVDPDRKTLDVKPLRSAEWHLNVLPFLEPPPLVNLTLESLEFPDYYTIEADIGLFHPFVDSDFFTGFDVCGILLTVGTDYKYGHDLLMSGSGDTHLVNPDGYSRWWNAAEFPHAPVFGYSSGLLGTPYSYATEYDCIINAYKYYCDELGADDDISIVTPAARGVFSPGSKNVRNYILKFGARGLTFNYAIDASWEVPVGSEPYDVPGDFPPEANRSEPYRIEVTVDSNTLIYDDFPSASGSGSAELTVDVYDWFDASSNILHCRFPYGMPAINNLTPVSSDADHATYTVNIDGANLNMSGELEILFVCESEDNNYDNFLMGKDVCSYFTYILNVPDATSHTGWGHAWGEGSNSTIREPRVAIDNIGNTFITGYFQGTADMDPGPGVDMHSSVPEGMSDIFLLKFDADGNYQWGCTWGGTQPDHAGAVAVDNLGSAYVGGAFWGEVDFDPGPGTFFLTSTPLPAPDYYSADAFLTKIDTSGNFVWAVSWGGGLVGVQYGSTFDTVYDLATDDYSNIYATGLYADDMIDFDPGIWIDNHTSNGGNDAYLVKYNSGGTYQWGRTWGSLIANDTGKGVAIDDSGFVCVCGYFEGIVDFKAGPGTEYHSSNGSVDAFVSKFDDAGTHQWSRTWGGGSYERGYSVAVDNITGAVYTAGVFWSDTDFDPGAGVDIHYPDAGHAYLSKLNSNGGYLWAETWSGNAIDVAVDDIGNVCISGDFMQNSDFDTGPGIAAYMSKGSEDAYLIKLDSTGAFTWARTWGAFAGDFGTSIAIDSSGIIYLAGNNKYVVDFDPGPGYGIYGNFEQYGHFGFVTKILPDGYW